MSDHTRIIPSHGWRLAQWAGLLGSILSLSAGCLKPYCEEDADCAEDQRCNLDRKRCEARVPQDSGGLDGGDAAADAGLDASTGCVQDDCDNPTPICDATSLECRSCAQDQECASLGIGRPWCDGTSCVECHDSVLHCAESSPICDATSLECRGCQRDEECIDLAVGRPWCMGSSCAECSTSAHCLQAEKAVCDSASHACRPCETHGECELFGGICDEGACLPEAQILYVDASATCAGATGSRAAPFCEISQALNTSWTGRRVVHVANGTYSPFTVTDQSWIVGAGGDVIVDAAGATQSPTVWVTNQIQTDAADVVLEGLEITGAHSTRAGLFCNTAEGPPLLTMRGCTVSGNADKGLVLNGCTSTLIENEIFGNVTTGLSLSGGSATLYKNHIHDNLVGLDLTSSALDLDANRIELNPGGGVQIDKCTGMISNNLIVNNGDIIGTVGAVFIKDTAGTLVLLHNTIADNQTSEPGHNPGVFCNTTLTNCFEVALNSNLLSNPVNPPRADLSDGFEPLYCFIGTGSVSTIHGNITGDPAFVDHVDYRLAPGSPCLGTGDPGIWVATDRDGENRPQPAGTRPDIGADEAP
ncbi:MAG: right-handed parallel beta-helix repeat-containing protein [Polyangia bacterium]|jgi:parallel beta-helix repeat protein|nr:right-handed parallel beta-helix repeat-containing protein [Polyangia bacterium]